MPAAEQVSHLAGHQDDVFGAIRLSVQNFDGIIPGVVLHQRKGHQYRVSLNLGKPEGSHALPESTHNRKTDLPDAQTLSDRIFVWKRKGCQFVRDQADLAVGLLVDGVQEAALEDQQVADDLKSFGGSK